MRIIAALLGLTDPDTAFSAAMQRASLFAVISYFWAVITYFWKDIKESTGGTVRMSFSWVTLFILLA
jgi:undecaprenyl-diphosphatase